MTEIINFIEKSVQVYYEESIHKNNRRLREAMKRILVPTDFSASSKASLKLAIDLASRAGADVYVVHMNQLPLLPETQYGHGT